MPAIATLLTTAMQQFQAGQWAKAEQLYQQVLQQQPQHPMALYALGLLAHQSGNLAEAGQYYQQALATAPRNVGAWVNLGAVFHAQGQLSEAIAHYQTALRLQPNHADALVNLGISLQQQGRVEAAIGRYQKALRYQPNLPAAHSNLGHAFRQQGQYDSAIAHYQTALQLEPHNPIVYQQLGELWVEMGQIPAAIACFEQGLALDPRHVTLQGSRIRALLLSGDLRAGFAVYDPWRLGLSPPRLNSLPDWDGSDLSDRRILLYVESGAGFGDLIQFSRYAALIAQQANQTVLECPEPLYRLFQPMAGVQCVPIGQPMPEVDCQVSLLSLPQRCGTELSTIPASVPYLVPPATLGPSLPSGDRKVGLVWGGNPNHRHDSVRSCPFSLMQRLLTVPNWTFYSLQKGPHQAELTSELPIHDLSSLLQDFADTAQVMQQLDLVITVDTSVAHLAGALGKPVWVLLARNPDWRWLLDRENSPWYPTARLFRQQPGQGWAEVCDRVRLALQQWPDGT